MNGLNARLQGWLVWLLPFVVLAVVIAWEADWGRKWRHVPAVDAVVVPQPVVVAVLPEYQPVATMATQHDLVDRALFNATRRPAPAAPSEGKKRLQAGQFVLTGTLIIDGKATAFLRENAGGKSRRVAQGEQVNGMTVADVKPDRVKLTLGDESEDLVLIVAKNSKVTTQPVPIPPVAATAGAPAGTPAGAPGTPSAADILAERRRTQQLADQAAAAAKGRPPTLTAPAPGAYAPPTAAPATTQLDPRWAETDARIRARNQAQMARPAP